MDIIVINTSDIVFAQLEKYLAFVSVGRRQAVLKKRSDDDKVQSLVAALLVRSELARRLGISASRICFEKGAHGKPYVKGSKVQFSLSHTKGAVCVAFSVGDEEIGVDIELKSRRVSDNLMNRTLSENEKALVNNDEAFIRCWVKKEAFLKRLGIGVATHLGGVDTTIIKELSAFECGEYYIGASGYGAENASISVVTVQELLSRLKEK